MDLLKLPILRLKSITMPPAALRPAAATGEGDTKLPELSIPLSGRVFATAFCPWGNGSPSLLALGLRASVVILQLRFAEEEEAMTERLNVQVIREVRS